MENVCVGMKTVLGTEAAIQRKMLRRDAEDGAEHIQGIFSVDVRGLGQGRQHVVIVGAGLGAESAGDFAKDDARANHAFGVVVVGADPVWEVQKRQKFVLLFE